MIPCRYLLGIMEKNQKFCIMFFEMSALGRGNKFFVIFLKGLLNQIFLPIQFLSYV